MNPILLKPSSDTGSQVVVHGKVYGNMDARTYHVRKEELREKVLESLETLRRQFELVLIEGAGSPAEINLKDRDLVNMGVAKMARAPVLLVGDIDRGGVFASLYGTIALLDEDERPYIKGMIINKFRGDVSLLNPGLVMIEEKTSVPVVGVVPYFHDLYLPEEDSVGLQKRMGAPDGAIRIGVIRLSHISNFTDFDILAMEPEVSVEYITPVETLDGLDALIIPGSKNTLADLTLLRESGLDQRIVAFAEEGGTVAGLCGGYQILGKSIRDPEHVESHLESVAGLGLLDTETVMAAEKTTTLDVAKRIGGGRDERLEGYEIHMGVTQRGTSARPLFQIISRNGRSCDVLDGAVNVRGNVWGTYLHGIFDNDAFRHDFLNVLRRKKGLPLLPRSGVFFKQRLQESVSRLARTVADALNMKAIERIIREGIEG